MPRLAEVNTFAVAYPFQGHFKFFTGPPALPAGRRTVVVRLTTEDGVCGWGQAVPSPRWSYETSESVRSTIDLYLAPELIGLEVGDSAEIAQRLHRAIAPSFSVGQPIAKAAIDLALWDLRGKLRGQSVGQMWRRAASTRPITLSWTLNPARLDDVEPAVAQAHAEGYRHFNIKVAPDPAFDLEVCRLVRRLAPSAFLWVDANGGYDLASAVAVAPKLAELGISAIEQPLRANDLAGYQALRRQRALPVLLDEPVITCADFETFRELDLMDGVAVKVSRMGGLTEACRLVDRLRETGMMFYASGLTDPDLSLAASIVLFSAGELALPAALNGPQFLRGSILKTPLIRDGDQMTPPTGAGLGVELDLTQLQNLGESSGR